MALDAKCALQYLTLSPWWPWTPPSPFLSFLVSVASPLNYNVHMSMYAYFTGHFILRYSGGGGDVPGLLASCPRITQVQFVKLKFVAPSLGWETASILIAGLQYPVHVLYSRERDSGALLHIAPPQGSVAPLCFGKKTPSDWGGGWDGGDVWLR